MDSKTISTSPSFINARVPSSHPYHQYETLLHYITTFVYDLRISILALKQELYNLVGVELPSRPSPADAKDCEIEHMMWECRAVREDTMRMTGLLRGFNRGKQLKVYLSGLETYEKPPVAENARNTICNLALRSHKDLMQEKGDETQQMGFLTFRQYSKSEDLVQAPFSPAPSLETSDEEDFQRALYLIELVRSQLEASEHEWKEENRVSSSELSPALGSR